MGAAPRAAAHRRSGGGFGGFLGLFLLILAIEVVLDIVLLPADVVLVPAEVIGDALLLAGIGGGAYLAGRKGTPSGARLGGHRTSTLRGNRKATLRAGRRGVSGTGMGLILGVWLFVGAILLFQYWWSVHHPILNLLTFPFELLFDVVVVVIAVVFTFVGLLGGGPAPGSRQVGD